MGGGTSGRALPHVDDLDGNIVLVVADLLDNAAQRRRWLAGCWLRGCLPV